MAETKKKKTAQPRKKAEPEKKTAEPAKKITEEKQIQMMFTKIWVKILEILLLVKVEQCLRIYQHQKRV